MGSEKENQLKGSSVESPAQSFESPPTQNLNDQAKTRKETNQENNNPNLEFNQNVQAYEDFESMQLKSSLLRGIYGYGFEKPSVIQQKAIVPCLNKNDVIAQAQSGSGKTATFGIAVLNNVEVDIRENQAIILAPTRELAIQHSTVMRCLGEFLLENGLNIHTSVGGQNTR